jgi:hypothetical protein
VGRNCKSFWTWSCITPSYWRYFWWQILLVCMQLRQWEQYNYFYQLMLRIPSVTWQGVFVLVNFFDYHLEFLFCWPAMCHR